MSACMSGTHGSGVLSSTGDVLVRGVGGVCDMCMCLARGGVGGEGGEWMREMGLGFTNPVGTGGGSNDLSLHEVELSGNNRCQQIEINTYPDSPLFISTGFLPRVSSKRLN